MSLRFRQSFQLFPGVRLNLSRSGISASFGVPGAILNVGPRGARSTIGIPGTGLYYTQRHGSLQPGHAPTIRPDGPPRSDAPPGYTPAFVYQQMSAMREINSVSVEELTSHSLVELRDLIAQARLQRNEVEDDLKEARGLQSRDLTDLDRRQRSIFRFFYKRHIAELEASLPETEAEIARLEEWCNATHVKMSFETGDEAKRTYASLVRAFDALRSCHKIWDITADREADRVAERSWASRNVNRRPVAIGFASSELIQFEGRAMRFGNVNGEDIIIYPGMVLMPRADGAFALIDLREVRLDFEPLNFVEHETVPSDSQIVGETWAKVNKDGSRDMRFRDNYRMPIALYGRMIFTSPGGVEEEYQFSNVEAAAEFKRAFEAYRAAIAE
jgi:hypothetical protein